MKIESMKSQILSALDSLEKAQTLREADWYWGLAGGLLCSCHLCEDASQEEIDTLSNRIKHVAHSVCSSLYEKERKVVDMQIQDAVRYAQLMNVKL